MRASETVTDTVLSAVCPPYTAVTVIFAVPTPSAVTVPPLTVATPSAELAYVTESGVTSSLPNRAVHTSAKVSVSYSESCVLFSERLSTACGR